MNASPTNAALTSAQRPLLLCTPTTAAHSAATSSALITESIVSLRAVSTAIGSTASASAAIEPASRPHARASAAYSIATAAIPPSASGSASAVRSKPSSLVAATCSHRSSGGLSIAICPLGSSAPKKKLCQESPMLRTAAS
ncbi:MAG TPA: hypothetical protein VHU13_05480 [Solirubrobacteraceae bacterium]|nr:hypothetical protein [Solirubrobacteraceae bacterium]